jgi:hypothetical protein
MEQKRKAIEDYLDENGNTLFADGFDDAIIGITVGIASRDVVVYDYDECIRIMTGNGISHEDAIEFLEYNTINAYTGEYTPIFVKSWKNLENF